MSVFDSSPLQAIAQKRRGVVIAMVSSFTVVLAVTVWSALALIDAWQMWPNVVRGGLMVIAVVCLALVARKRWRTARSQTAMEQIICDVEAASPQGGQQLRTAHELASRETKTDEEHWLWSRLMESAHQQVRAVNEDQLVPKHDLMRWVAIGGASLVALMIAALVSSEFRLALWRVAMPIGAPTYTKVTWQSAPTVFDDLHPARLAVTVTGRAASPRLQLRERGAETWQTHGLNALPDGQTFDAVVTGLAKDFEARVLAGDGATDVRAVRYRPIPRLEETKLVLHYPNYTGRDSEEREGGDVSVVEGSTVDWSFRFNTAPGHVEWKLASGTNTPQAIPLQSDGATLKATWKLPLGRFSGVLTLFDTDGSTLDSWKYEVVGLVDKLPIVQLLEPSKDTKATCVTELPVRIRARDDFGVAEVGLIMEAAGQTIWTLEKVITEKNERDVFEMTRAMLETIPLTINDNIKLYAYALDHKPRGGPRSVSALRAIDIRDFKRLERMGKGGDKPPPLNPLNLAKLEKLIKLERVVVSECHVTNEEAQDDTAENIPTKCRDTAVKQAEVFAKTGELVEFWKTEPGISRDDQTLLGAAQAQMGETGRHLARALTEQALGSSDRALGSLLQLRRHMMLIFGKGSCECENEDDSEPPKPLEELAREAERLANEEQTVQTQITPQDKKLIVEIAMARRQQEVALSDAGELFAAIVTHPNKHEMMEKLMAVSERQMHKADEQLHTKEPTSATPSLAEAEKNLRDLADFIRALDQQKQAEALQKMANKAESDSKGCGKGAGTGQGKGDSKGESKAGKDGSKAKELADAKKGESGKGQQGQDGQGKGTDGKGGGDPGKMAEAARNAELAAQILKALEEQAGAKGGKGSKPGEDGKGEGQSSGSKGLSAEELAALRKRIDVEQLAKDLKALADAQGKAGDPSKGTGDGDKGKTGDSTKGGDVMKGVADAQGKGAASKGNGDRGKASDPTRGGDAQGDLAGVADRLAKMAKELRAEAGRLNATRLAQLAEVREKAKALRDRAMAEEAAEERSFIAQMQANGAKPGQKFPFHDRVVTIPSKPVEPPVNRGSGANHAGEIARFAAEAKRLGDAEIHSSLQWLDQQVPPLAPLQAIVKRLDMLIAELPGGGIPQTAQTRVPETYRRDIEAYTRNLSDDLGDDSK